MENIIAVIFKDERSTYQALSDLKNRAGDSVVLQAGILQNVGGSIVTKDGWSNADEGGAWAAGGLLGGLVGILGGPVGMLLGASLGVMAGGVVDLGDLSDEAGVIEQAAHKLGNGDLALMLIADETNDGELDSFFQQYAPSTVIRRDVAAVQQEIYQAEEAADELRRQARAKMREEKKAEWTQKARAAQDKIKQDFEKVKSKITS